MKGTLERTLSPAPILKMENFYKLKRRLQDQITQQQRESNFQTEGRISRYLPLLDGTSHHKTNSSLLTPYCCHQIQL